MPRKPVPVWPASWKEFDAHSIQALAQGRASDAQQKRALDWIINRACGTYDRSAVSENANETFFNEGRRDAGRQILYLMKIDMSAIADLRAKAKRTAR